MNHAVLEARFAAGARSLGELPPPLQSELAFAGRSNVGKSSLLNALMNRRNLARTSSTPGCTRAINFFEVRTREDSWLTLVDLPGYGYANRSKTERRSWGDLLEGYLLERPVLRGVAILVDVRRGLEHEEQELLKMLADDVRGREPLRTLIVATKLDRLPKGQRAGAVARLGVDARKIVGFSTAIPETTDAVWRRLVG